jgi:acyl-CoA synthetase (AMP-forming)/AMP-acid ligase II
MPVLGLYLIRLLALIPPLPISLMAAEVEWMDSEDTLFYLYTSGSTGKPKGVVHTMGGFMVSCTAGASWAAGPSRAIPELSGRAGVYAAQCRC